MPPEVAAGWTRWHGNPAGKSNSGAPTRSHPVSRHRGHRGTAWLRAAHGRAASMRNQGRPGVRIGQALRPYILPAKNKLPFVRVPDLHLPEAGEIDFVAPGRCMKILPPKIVWRLKKDHQHSSSAAAGFSRPAGVRRQPDRGRTVGFVSLRRDESRSSRKSRLNPNSEVAGGGRLAEVAPECARPRAQPPASFQLQNRFQLLTPPTWLRPGRPLSANAEI